MKKHISICAITCLVLGGLAVIQTGCVRQKEYIIPTTLRVFPMDSGKYRIYEVIDTTWNTNGPVVEHYYRKEVQLGIQADGLGRPSRRIETFRSPLDSGANYVWEVDRVWTHYKDSEDGRTGYAERYEDNQRYLVLKYPIYTDSTYTWDPNKYRNGEDLNDTDRLFRYLDADSLVTLNANYCPQCVTSVEQTFQHCVYVLENTRNEITSPAFYRKAYSIYAPEIGKIFEFHRRVVNDGNPPNPFNADKSFSHIERLVEHN